MGSTWISWRTTLAVFITILQIQALISVRCKTAAGVEGQTFDFRCEYGDSEKNNPKFFCLGENNMSGNDFIRTDKHNKWERKGRYSIYDNSSGSFFIVRVDKLVLEDSRIHCCGVADSSGLDRFSFICLNVSRANTSDKFSHHTTESSFGINMTLDKIHLPLYLTAVMCVGALLIVCLFTLCLLLVVKQRKSNSTRLERESASDYVTMMPNVTTEPLPDPAELSGVTTALYSHLTKQRESTTSHNSEYAEIESMCQYEDLDVSQIDEHIYQSIRECSRSKNENLDLDEPIMS